MSSQIEVDPRDAAARLHALGDHRVDARVRRRTPPRRDPTWIRPSLRRRGPRRRAARGRPREDDRRGAFARRAANLPSAELPILVQVAPGSAAMIRLIRNGRSVTARVRLTSAARTRLEAARPEDAESAGVRDGRDQLGSRAGGEPDREHRMLDAESRQNGVRSSIATRRIILRRRRAASGGRRGSASTVTLQPHCGPLGQPAA